MQKSIKDSVLKLLADQIKTMELSHFYEVLQSEIRGANGTTFSFEGIRLNASSLKSYEGVDICWVEEAQTVSAQSWKDLIPTIRKENSNIHGEPSWSEIWLSFNPELETDPTYERFIKKRPSNSFSEHLTWRDNPWFPAVLRMEMEDLKNADYNEYLHVWEGQCKQNLEGAIYADQMRELAARNGARDSSLGGLPVDRSAVVDCIFDIGKSDFTSIWFKQLLGWEHRYVDFHQSNRKDPADHAQIIRERGYNIGTIWLPHDAKAKRYGSKLSVEEQFREFFPGQVRLVPRLSILDGIAAGRTIFNNCWFDADRCADGLTALRHYRWEVDPVTKMYGKTPLHDQYSDAADAFRYSAIISKLRIGKSQLALNVPGTNRPASPLEIQGGQIISRPQLELNRNAPHMGGGGNSLGWLK